MAEYLVFRGGVATGADPLAGEAFGRSLDSLRRRQQFPPGDLTSAAPESAGSGQDCGPIAKEVPGPPTASAGN